MRVAIVAGETSGDLLGVGLMKELRARCGDVEFEGIGGELMMAEGLKSRCPMERLQVMGLTEVLGRLRELLKLRRKLIRRWLKNPPDLFIGIDSPDFNLGLEMALRRRGIATAHYVSPSVWAWRRKRIFKIKDACDLMLTLLPFETPIYEEHAIRAQFVGHPLASKIPMHNDAEEALGRLHRLEAAGTLKVQRNDAALPLDSAELANNLVALLPGSRGGEVSRLAEPFLDTARWLLQHHPQLQFIIPAAGEKRFAQLSELLNGEYSDLPVTLTQGHARDVMATGRAILIASGTATLEAMLVNRPLVVAYRMAPLSYRIISRMLTTDYISLPNLLARKALVPEVLQNDVTAEKLGPLMQRALYNEDYRDQLTQAFAKQHEVLARDADSTAADAVVSLLRDKGVIND